MDSLQIQENLPKIFSILESKSLPEPLWAQISQDLKDFLWLNFEEGKDNDLINGILQVSDRFGLCLLEKKDFFPTYDLNQVLFFIHNSLYSITSHKDKAKEICLTSKKLINEMNFFKKCKTLLEDAVEEKLVEVCKFIEECYKGFKQNMVTLTIQLEKSIQTEFDKSFGEVLDEIFYTEVLYPSKSKLKYNSSLSHILSDYKGNRYFTSSKYQSNYYSNYSKGENIYIGELNEFDKKHGYGKMFYLNKDTYEGYWANDKPNGKGLYIWKDGGKYLGLFHQGQMNGEGKRLYSSGCYYEGEFLNNKRNGKGVMKFKNGDVYDGEWHDEDMQGRGMYKWASGDFYIGEFKRDKRDGKGTLTLSTGEIYESTWDNGSMKKEENSL